MGVPFDIIKKANETTSLYSMHSNLKNFREQTNPVAIAAHGALYGQFRIVKAEWRFRLTSTQVYTDTGNDKITSIVHAYDPDAQGRLLKSPKDMYMLSNYKKRDMKPYQSYKVTLFPQYGIRNTTGTLGGSEALYSNSKSGVWMDISDMSAAGMESLNGQHVLFEGLNHLTKTSTEITGQLYVTWQFRGVRNGQEYAP
ncbi:unnamed protein product [Mytilus edulis]|uniref:Uncharacterized protein n=1 Tax=Mytilus edulis TaxID=6550 RepID=A0A8S3SEQ0_MYTED|nr:unnamed protein product [Mytilus edulis]